MAQVAIQESQVTRPIDLFRAAIDSPTGSFRTQVYGPLAQKVQQSVGAPNTPVFAEITTVETFKQEGCKRLAMKLSTPQHQMKLSSGGMAPFAATWTLNVCRDGSPPMEAVDLAKAGQMFDKGQKPAPLPQSR
jgi:hypothetical protein